MDVAEGKDISRRREILGKIKHIMAVESGFGVEFNISGVCFCDTCGFFDKIMG